MCAIVQVRMNQRQDSLQTLTSAPSDTEIKLQKGGENHGPRYACPHRNRPVEESLTEFRAMRDGKYKPREAFLRMKQDLQDGNPQMWDLPLTGYWRRNTIGQARNGGYIPPTTSRTVFVIALRRSRTHYVRPNSSSQESLTNGCATLLKSTNRCKGSQYQKSF